MANFERAWREAKGEDGAREFPSPHHICLSVTRIMNSNPLFFADPPTGPVLVSGRVLYVRHDDVQRATEPDRPYLRLHYAHPGTCIGKKLQSNH